MIIEIKHSGELGDIIYSIPTMLFLMRRQNAERIRLYVTKNKLASRPPGLKHVGGRFMVSAAMFDYVKPLLEHQSCFDEIHFVEEDKIPASAVDFDLIRTGGLNVAAGNIKDYYSKAFGSLSDGPARWIEPRLSRKKPDHDIVFGRSTRYLNNAIDYRIVDQLSLKVGFLGLEHEFFEFCLRNIGIKVEHIATSSALDACDVIANAPLYIGNQSFFFAVAEALQTSRFLEVFEPVPNVVPTGGKTGQFITTRGLATLLESFFNKSLILSNDASVFNRSFVLSA
ncbi:hypothetical protein P3T24_003412 [Paraburkholderia sp. GAS33]|jgi:hypothetical protein|uniref:hypothetical protein n=1 Tax=Paraburkholderia sp. GAS33 TaxID=3035130 RepID=UPI003D251A4D